MSATLRRLGVLADAPRLNEARERARAIIAEAEREAASIRERAREDALEARAALTLAERVAFARALEVEESTVIALACDVARSVLGREACSGDEVLRDVTRRAIERVRRARRVALRVHPDDAESAERSAREWLPEGCEPVDLWVVRDETVDRGGVIVETEIGRIDARLDVQRAEVARILDGSRRVV